MKLYTAFAFLCMVRNLCFGERLGCENEWNQKWPLNRVNTTDQVTYIKRLFTHAFPNDALGLSAIIITSYDENLGYFISPQDMILKYLTGFSGYYGFGIVSKTGSAFFTTKQFYELADQQLDCIWELFEIEQYSVTSAVQWLKHNLESTNEPNLNVGINKKMVPYLQWKDFRSQLAEFNISLIGVRKTFTDLLWAVDETEVSHEQAFVWPLEYAGETWKDKVDRLRYYLRKIHCDAMVVTALEEIAWLLNIRGNDIMYLPFVKAYLWVGVPKLKLFLVRNKASREVINLLITEDINYTFEISSYENALHQFRELTEGVKMVCVPSPCSFSSGASAAVVRTVPEPKRLFTESPIISMKARKNANETRGIRNANVRDCVALVETMAFVGLQVKAGTTLTGNDIVKRIEKQRNFENLTKGMSYPPVVAFGKDGAVLHHGEHTEGTTMIDNTSTLIIDTGSHYLDGTTATARTFHFGTPNAEMIIGYTTLVEAHIRISEALFPEHIKLSELNIILRSKLWEDGIEYNVNIGHGIGTFTNIFESPVEFPPGPDVENRTVQPGQFIYCDPMYIMPGVFGIKIGNVYEFVLRKVKNKTFMGLNIVTLVPYEIKLLSKEKLSKADLDWVNKYHKRIMGVLSKQLRFQSRKDGFSWLISKTKEIRIPCKTSHTSGFPSPLLLAFSTIIQTWRQSKHL